MKRRAVLTEGFVSGFKKQAIPSTSGSLEELARAEHAKVAAGRHPDFGALPFFQDQEPHSKPWLCEP